MLVACPITSEVKGYAFEVKLPDGLSVQGCVLTDQIRALDWVSRTVEYKGKSTATVLLEVRAKLKVLLGT